MAIVKLSSIVTDIRGAVGGNVFFKGKNNSVVRQKVTQNFNKTLVIRNRKRTWAANAYRWRTLTETQRKAWNSAVVQWKRADVFGDLIQPSGFNLYMKLNTVLLNQGFTLLTLPPTPLKPPLLTSFSIVLSRTASSLVMTTTINAPLNSWFAYLLSTKSLSRGISKYDNQLIQWGGGQVPGTSANLYDTWTTFFGLPVIGQRVFFEVAWQNFVTGQQNRGTVISVIVV